MENSNHLLFVITQVKKKGWNLYYNNLLSNIIYYSKSVCYMYISFLIWYKKNEITNRYLIQAMHNAFVCYSL